MAKVLNGNIQICFTKGEANAVVNYGVKDDVTEISAGRSLETAKPTGTKTWDDFVTDLENAVKTAEGIA